MNKKEIIVIGDVHGRTFWRDAVKGDVEDKFFIFLGDYIDPYPSEAITPKMAFEVFKEIVDFKKQHMVNVILLIGNHDATYMSPKLENDRCDYLHMAEINAFIEENRRLFQMCYMEERGKKFLFSHAGIMPGWLDECGLEKDETLFDRLNQMWWDDDPELYEHLSKVSFYRMGMSKYGSMVWADIHEMARLDDEKCVMKDYYQIIGHTRVNDERGFICSAFADLDCCHPFRITPFGKIEAI